MIRAQRAIAAAVRAFRRKPMVLMYHRIAKADYDPWASLCRPLTSIVGSAAEGHSRG